MSKTDKDKPYWVEAAWEPYHICRSQHTRSWQKLDRDCNLPENPPSLSEYSPTYNRRAAAQCIWLPDYDFTQIKGRSLREDISVTWNGPERRRERDELRKAAQDYNSNGDSDWDFWNRQHKHSVHWLMW